MIDHQLIAMARGKIKSDLVIKNAKIINVFTRTIETGDLAIAKGRILGIGNYQGEVEIDLTGYYLSPGFIDGHVHIESSMLTPVQYGQLTLPRGTTSIIADCHEIANVSGIKGIDFMLDSSKKSLQDVFMMIPSCVPSTPFETSGAVLNAKDIDVYIDHPQVKGLGEMMDFVGIINGEKEPLRKVNDYRRKVIDGHAPGLIGNDLNAYVFSGVQTDHECVDPKELIEKVKRGMYVHLREGSQTKNVLDLLPGLKPEFYQQILLCSDDLHPSDILKKGHIDHNIRLAIKYGIDPIVAISMATINIARCYRLDKLGAIAPGYAADIVAFKDMNNMIPELVFKKGELVAENLKMVVENQEIEACDLLNSVHIDEQKVHLDLSLKSDYVYVIGLIKNNITTNKIKRHIVLENGFFYSRNNQNLLKLAVIERHHFSNQVGFGLVQDYGLKDGAIAMTIAHDSHNIVCIGDNDSDMYMAISHLKEIGGGIVLVSNHNVVADLKLEVGGLMTLSSVEYVEERLLLLDKEARRLGVSDAIEDPFIQLAFLSLPVIPELKVTDKGLFDVNSYKIIPIEVGD